MTNAGKLLIRPMQHNIPKQECHAVGGKFELPDDGSHRVSTCLRLHDQLGNLSPVNLVGNKAPDHDDCLVHQVLVELWGKGKGEKESSSGKGNKRGVKEVDCLVITFIMELYNCFSFSLSLSLETSVKS